MGIVIILKPYRHYPYFYGWYGSRFLDSPKTPTIMKKINIFDHFILFASLVSMLWSCLTYILWAKDTCN